MRYYRIRNWKDYQHYKKRNPPWIKLHYALLASRDWVMLSDASRVLAIASMLLASRNDGRIPIDPDYIKRVAYLNDTPDFTELIKVGFVLEEDEDASTLQAHASKLQADARPETETETETEKEAERETQAFDDIKRFDPNQVLDFFPEKVRQPALQSAMAYQTRRYGAPRPGARWYPDLLREAAAVFEVQDNPQEALQRFLVACKGPMSVDLPRDATFSSICLYCGLKRSKPPPWEAAKKQPSREEAQRIFAKALEGVGRSVG